MKPILISLENAALVNARLQEAEGRATERTLDCADVLELIEQLDAHPAVSLLPATQQRGILAFLQKAHELPNRYRYRAQATTVKVERRIRGWYLVDALRTDNRNAKSDRIDVSLPPEVAAKARAYFEQTFYTQPAGD